jgi:hypothetical protein
MDQVSINYTNIFHCKTLQNLPKFGFLVWKQIIWQHCSECEIVFGHNCRGWVWISNSGPEAVSYKVWVNANL